MARFKKNRPKSRQTTSRPKTKSLSPVLGGRSALATANTGPYHILIACGGTGGHLYPGIAVAEVLQARGHRATLLISEKKIDDLAASGHSGLTFEKMPFLAMPKPWSPKMPAFVMGVWKGLKHCKAMIKKEDTRVVLGMGGFTSFAPVLAGRQSKIKTLIHDSNAIPGKANKLTARFTDLVLLGFKECASFFPKNETRITGTPVRTTLIQGAETGKEEPYQFFGLDPARKTLLVIGGSQGARGINNAIGQSLRELDGLGIQILHITGPGDYQTVSDSYEGKEMKLHAHVAAFCQRMELAYQIADVALARSGASTLAELAYFGVPSLLVPYPYAADDHQTKNAEIFDKVGAGILITEMELSPEKLTSTVRELLTNEKKRRVMEDAAKKLSNRYAAEGIADIVLELAAN